MSGSDAWRALNGSAVKVYIALLRFNLGDNNGSLFFSVETGMLETGLARNTVHRALVQLEEFGFIAAVERGHFRVKGGPGTTWRLTHLPAPGCKPSVPTNEWQRWKAPERASGNKTRSQLLKRAVAESETGLETRPRAVSKIDTGHVETSLVSVTASISKKRYN